MPKLHALSDLHDQYTASAKQASAENIGCQLLTESLEKLFIEVLSDRDKTSYSESCEAIASDVSVAMTGYSDSVEGLFSNIAYRVGTKMFGSGSVPTANMTISSSIKDNLGERAIEALNTIEAAVKKTQHDSAQVGTGAALINLRVKPSGTVSPRELIANLEREHAAYKACYTTYNDAVVKLVLEMARLSGELVEHALTKGGEEVDVDLSVVSLMEHDHPVMALEHKAPALFEPQGWVGGKFLRAPRDLHKGDAHGKKMSGSKEGLRNLLIMRGGPLHFVYRRLLMGQLKVEFTKAEMLGLIAAARSLTQLYVDMVEKNRNYVGHIYYGKNSEYSRVSRSDDYDRMVKVRGIHSQEAGEWGLLQVSAHYQARMADYSIYELFGKLITTLKAVETLADDFVTA
jgi:hypothetical protein